MTTAFPKSQRLLFGGQFRRVRRGGHRYVGRWVILDACHSRGSIPRLGISVSTKFGKAHQRNRFKRIVREGFRQCQGQLPRHLDLVVRPRTAAALALSSDIEAELLELLGSGGSDESGGGAL